MVSVLVSFAGVHQRPARGVAEIAPPPEGRPRTASIRLGKRVGATPQVFESPILRQVVLATPTNSTTPDKIFLSSLTGVTLAPTLQDRREWLACR